MSSRFPNSRADAAKAIVAKGGITRSPSGGFYVPSSDGINVYHVSLDDRGEPRCTCPDFERRQAACKHCISCALLVVQESAK